MTLPRMHPRTITRPHLLAGGLALLASLVVNVPAHSQGRSQPDSAQLQRHGERAERRLERRLTLLTERLKLSPEQTTQVRQILARQHEQIRALWEKAPARDDAERSDRQNVRAEMHAIRERTRQQIEGVLTEEQRARYRELRAARGKGRAGEGGRGPHGERSRHDTH